MGHLSRHHPIRIEALAEAQNYRCCYCPRIMTLEEENVPETATRDHIIPRVFGGPTEWWNLAAACNECNWLRGHMDANRFFRLRQFMTTEQIREIRFRIIAREDEKFRLIVLSNIELAKEFSIRWLRRNNLLQTA